MSTTNCLPKCECGRKRTFTKPLYLSDFLFSHVDAWRIGGLNLHKLTTLSFPHGCANSIQITVYFYGRTKSLMIIPQPVRLRSYRRQAGGEMDLSTMMSPRSWLLSCLSNSSLKPARGLFQVSLQLPSIALSCASHARMLLVLLEAANGRKLGSNALCGSELDWTSYSFSYERLTDSPLFVKSRGLASGGGLRIDTVGPGRL